MVETITLLTLGIARDSPLHISNCPLSGDSQRCNSPGRVQCLLRTIDGNYTTCETYKKDNMEEIN